MFGLVGAGYPRRMSLEQTDQSHHSPTMQSLLLAAESVGLTGAQVHYALRAAVSTAIDQIEVDSHHELLVSLAPDVAALAISDPPTDPHDVARVSLTGGVGFEDAQKLLPLVRSIITSAIESAYE
jgi:hypothetical protein